MSKEEEGSKESASEGGYDGCGRRGDKEIRRGVFNKGGRGKWEADCCRVLEEVDEDVERTSSAIAEHA